MPNVNFCHKLTILYDSLYMQIDVTVIMNLFQITFNTASVTIVTIRALILFYSAPCLVVLDAISICA